MKTLIYTLEDACITMKIRTFQSMFTFSVYPQEHYFGLTFVWEQYHEITYRGDTDNYKVCRIYE